MNPNHSFFIDKSSIFIPKNKIETSFYPKREYPPNIMNSSKHIDDMEEEVSIIINNNKKDVEDDN